MYISLGLLALSLLAPDRDALAQDRALNQQVQKYLAAKPYPELSRTVQAWSKYPDSDRRRLTLKLIDKLSDRAYVGMTEQTDMVIFYRVETGDMKMYGHGGQIYQDLFLVGGRAAWALSEMYEVRGLPELNAGLSQEEWNKRAKQIAARFAPEELPILGQVQTYMNVLWWWQLRLIAQSWAKLPQQKRHHIAEELVHRLDQSHGTWLRESDHLHGWRKLIDRATPSPITATNPRRDLQRASGRAAYALGQMFKIDDVPMLEYELPSAERRKRAQQIADRINEKLTAK